MTTLSMPGSSVAGAMKSCAAALSEHRRALEHRLARLDAQLGVERRRHDELMARLEDGEGSRRLVLTNPARFGSSALAEVGSTYFDLRAEVGAVEERMAGVSAQLAGLGEERTAVERLTAQVQRLADTPIPPPDPAALRYHAAARRVFQLADEDRVATLRTAGADPVKALDDLIFATEMAGRLAVNNRAASRAEVIALAGKANTALHSIRRLAHELHPPALMSGGLVAALRELLDLYAVESTVQVRMDIVGTPRRLPAEVELTLYRVAEEALRNTRTHARSSQAQLIVVFHHPRVAVVVRDEGDGFDVHATLARLGVTRRLGLITMRERVELLGGRLELRSQVGAGTEVRATVDA